MRTGRSITGHKTFARYGHVRVTSRVRTRRSVEVGTVRQIFELPAKGKHPRRVRAWVRWDDGTDQPVDVDRLVVVVNPG